MSDVQGLKLEYEKITRDQVKCHAGQLENLKESHKIELAKQQLEIQSLTAINEQLSDLRASRIDDVTDAVARLREQLEDKDAILKELSEAADKL